MLLVFAGSRGDAGYTRDRAAVSHAVMMAFPQGFDD